MDFRAGFQRDLDEQIRQIGQNYYEFVASPSFYDENLLDNCGIYTSSKTH